MSDEFKYEIKENLVTIPSGTWNLELNLISWNGADPKYDIRKWNADHSRMGKGISLTKEEMTALMDKLETLKLPD